MSNLEQLFLQRQKEKQEFNLKKKEEKPVILANRIRQIIESPEIIRRIEENLIEYGSVTLQKTPCTCESGGCIDTKGFKEHLKDVIQSWEEKGVLIDFGIKQTFYLKGVKHDRAFIKSSIYVPTILKQGVRDG